MTARKWQRRWSQHVTQSLSAKGKTCHFANAIRKYGKDAFDHEVLETCMTVEEANLAEEKWIAHFDTCNPEKGFNLTRGGGHTPHPIRNPWDRQEYREKATEASRRTWSCPDRRAAMSAAKIGVPLSDHHRSRISEAAAGKKHDEDRRARSSEAQRKSQARPEVKARHSEGLKRKWEDPTWSQIVRTRTSEGLVRMWADPQKRASFLSYDGSFKRCKVHGLVPLDDCYRKVHRNKYRTVSYECKACVLGAQRARYRRTGAG